VFGVEAAALPGIVTAAWPQDGAAAVWRGPCDEHPPEEADRPCS
jgi:hypothetical protein